MSIATELDNLNNDILDAYTAVGAKGGTVPANKNMDNLDTAIASIPSGGSTPTAPTLTSATHSGGVITLTGTDFGDSPDVLMFNRKYDRYDVITPTTSSTTTATIAVGSSDYGYYSRVVKVRNGGFESDVKFIYEDFENLGAGGYDEIAWCYTSNSNKVPLTAYGGAASVIGGSASVSYTSVISNAYTYLYTLTNVSTGISAGVSSVAIRGIEINPSLTTLDGTAIAPLSFLKILDQPMGFANVTTIINSNKNGAFGGNVSFNSPIDISSITTFGEGFMKFNTQFNQPLNVNSSAITFGTFWLAYCTAFNQPLTLPAGDANTPISAGTSFMRDCWAYSHSLTFDHWSIGGNSFLYNSCNLDSVNVISSTISSPDLYTLAIAPASRNCLAYTDGITVNGDSAATTWLTDLPSGNYRNLVQGTINS